MTRVKTGPVTRRRHKKVLKITKGHQGVRHTLYRRAHESMIHALQYAYDHRRQRKGDMRRLWNLRINAAARANGLTYSRLIFGLKSTGIDIDRKMLADLAVREPDAFAQIVEHIKGQLETSSV